MMRFLSIILIGLFAGAAEPPGEKSFGGEALSYSVNWPSGLSLGEAQLAAAKDGGQYRFTWHIEAAVPGFQVANEAKALATTQFCTVEAEKQTTKGARKSKEKTEFDGHGKAKRETQSGGKTDISVPACAKDALSFLYFARQELAQGRLPAQQAVLFGAPYQVRVQFGGRQTVRLSSGAVEADRLIATIKGPASEWTADLFFATDALRTPVLVKVPLALGTFAMELQR